MSTPQLIQPSDIKDNQYIGNPCKTCGGTIRRKSNKQCVPCGNVNARRWHDKNREASKAKSKEWRESNPDRAKEYRKQDYAKNADRYREASRIYGQEHFEERKEYMLDWRGKNKDKIREYERQYSNDNRHAILAKNAAHRARKLKATVWPEYALAIKTVYFGREMMEDLTGKPYHVDHSIPLKGKNVCGLHTPINLKVIPANDNLKKSNKFIAN